MKKIFGLFMALLFLHTIALCQNNTDNIQDPTFGIHFFFDDFKSASIIRSTSLNNALKSKQFGKLKDMSPGLALNYIQGLSSHFDLSAMLGASFTNFTMQNGITVSDDKFLLEGDVSVRGKLFTNKYWFTPYVQLGAGGSTFQGYWGAYIPAGIGFQLNFFDEAFLLINSQYRIPVTETSGYHFFHSIGLAGTIGKRKTSPKVLPPPPLPQPQPIVPKDTDGDGIVDSADACPDVKGPASLNGCPDADNDGIADKDDKCPGQPGIARYQGCPIPDTDGDGINDENDKCPNEKGIERYQGCPIPDRDKDGVNDEEDKCPDLPGTVANNGCPEVKEEVKRRVEMAAKNIFFVSGSSKLLPRSFPSLNEVVKVMNDDPNMKIDVEGHTDNTGTPEKNKTLSDKRAAAVASYITSKGIAADRVQSAGYGQERPVASNKTAAGKAKNRRVELKSHY